MGLFLEDPEKTRLKITRKKSFDNLIYEYCSSYINHAEADAMITNLKDIYEKSLSHTTNIECKKFIDTKEKYIHLYVRHTPKENQC